MTLADGYSASARPGASPGTQTQDTSLVLCMSRCLTLSSGGRTASHAVAASHLAAPRHSVASSALVVNHVRACPKHVLAYSCSRDYY